MQDKELFQIALGIKSPWYIKDLDLNIQEEQVTIYIEFERGANLNVLNAISSVLLTIPKKRYGDTSTSSTTKHSCKGSKSKV